MTEPMTWTGCLSSRQVAEADQRDVMAAVDGERAAFDRLVLRHQQKAMNAAYYFLGDYEDALEVSQEAFLSAYRGLKGYRGGASFRTWLLRIVINQAKSRQARRRAKKRSARIVSLSGTWPAEGRGHIEPPDTRFSPDDQALRGELKRRLEEAITELDPEARELIILRDLEGESYESIRRALDLPLGTVKSKVHRARLQIREALREYLEV